VRVVKNIGQDIDVLGLNLGHIQGPRRLMIFDPADFRNLENCLFDESFLSSLGIFPRLDTCPLYPDSHQIISWSDTRIRVQVNGLRGIFLVFIWDNSNFQDSQNRFRQRSNRLVVALP
jgi:hypothetical protein